LLRVVNLLAVETETRDSKLHVSVYNSGTVELFAPARRPVKKPV
jgi:hypothetical protein